jgi:uncharacterized protein YggU (UPF0235/DUF167 family)
VGVPSTRLRVRVVPGSAHPGVVGRYGDAWKLRVSEAPERGRANEAVLELLAESLSVPRRDVELVAGHGGRDKVVELHGIAEEEAVRRLSGER